MQRRRHALLSAFASVVFVGCTLVSGWSDLQENGNGRRSNGGRDASEEEEGDGSVPPGSSRDATTDRGRPPNNPSPTLPDCKTAGANDDCTCSDPAANCTRSCTDGACEYVAKSGVQATFRCNGGGCEVWCESGSQCVTDCQGGGCIVHCADGALCVNTCETGCTFLCATDACTNVCRNSCTELPFD